MVPQREIRYYASIPNLLLFMLFSGSIIALGWWAWDAIGGALVGALLVGVGGLGALAGLGLLVDAIVLRNPMLTVDDVGFTTSMPLRPSQHITYPWTGLSGIGITVQELGGQRSFTFRLYYLAVYKLDSDSEVESESRSKLAQYFMSMKPSFTFALPIASLDFLFLLDFRKRRAQMLERIKTTFAPELIRYNIWVDEVERTL